MHQGGEDENPRAKGSKERDADVGLALAILEDVVIRQDDGLGDTDDQQGLAADAGLQHAGDGGGAEDVRNAEQTGGLLAELLAERERGEEEAKKMYVAGAKM